MNLFLDTNVFLDFYYFTSEELEELKKLSVLLENDEVTLLLPDQIDAEFRRNRAGQIASALKRLQDQRLSLQFPNFCKEFEEYGILRRIQKEYGEVHATLLEAIEEAVGARELKADVLIEQLFRHAERIEVSGEILKFAQERVARGNPPGKGGSLGDALNWEALLLNSPAGEDLHLISADGDYQSALDRSQFNPFLLDEWVEEKGAQLIYYAQLADFFGENFPDIELASELEKSILITRLMGSANFSETHRLIARLRRFPEFTNHEIDQIIDAGMENNQVYWIMSDPDVQSFYSRILEEYGEQVSSVDASIIRERLAS